MVVPSFSNGKGITHCGSYCRDKAIKHPPYRQKTTESRTNNPQYPHNPFLKVLKGVGKFSQKFSDKKYFVLRSVFHDIDISWQFSFQKRHVIGHVSEEYHLISLGIDAVGAEWQFIF